MHSSHFLRNLLHSVDEDGAFVLDLEIHDALISDGPGGSGGGMRESDTGGVGGVSRCVGGGDRFLHLRTHESQWGKGSEAPS
jgi:hypothetical protein